MASAVLPAAGLGTRELLRALSSGDPGMGRVRLLVKGSRSMKMERVFHALEAKLPRVPDVASAIPVAARAGTEVIQVVPRTSPEDKASVCGP